VKPTTFRRTATVRIAAIAGLGLAAVLPILGCDKKPADQPAPATTTPPPAAKGPSIGVVDVEKVMADLGWTRDRASRAEAINLDLGREVQSLFNQLTTIAEGKKQTLIKDAKLSKEQIEQLNKGELDKLPLNNEQRNDFTNAMITMNNFANQAKQRQELVLRSWVNEANATYVTQMQPAIRRAAEAAGVSVVIPSNLALYQAPTVNLSDKVVDDLRGTTPANLPATPRLGMSINMDSATTQPAATSPSTPSTPAAPATTRPAGR
jgi:Skp family chaperone for outer membrane proteins